MQLAQYELNGRGGIRALGGRHLQIVAYDIGPSFEEAALAVARMDGVDFYTGGSGPSVADAVGAEAQSREKLFLATLPLKAPSRSEHPAPMTFHLRSDVRMLTSMLASAVKDRAITRWSIVVADCREGMEAADGFKTVLSSLLPETTFHSAHYFPEGLLDPALVNREIAAASPDGIFSAIQGNDLRTYLGHASTPPTVAHRTVASFNLPEHGDAIHHWHGLRTTRVLTGYDPDDMRTRSHRLFAQAYRTWHGTAPTYASLIGYVAVQILADLIERTGSLDGAYLAAALEGMAFETGAGPLIMRRADHQASFGAWVGEAEDRHSEGPPDWQFHDGLLHMAHDRDRDVQDANSFATGCRRT